MQSAPKLTGLSGNEIYCMRLKGLIPSGVVIGNSIQRDKDTWVNGASGLEIQSFRAGG